jgi:Carboxypeptidase regulatory-like domain
MLRKTRYLCPLLCLASSVAHAQIGRATILGAVTDTQNSIVPGASVTALQTKTNTVYRTLSNDAGLYTLPGVPIGAYDVTVEKNGFKREVRSGIVLQVDANARVDFHLEVGAVVESVEVRGDAALVETASATVGNVIENERISNLPLNGRNALTLVVLTPNVRSLANSAEGFADRGLEVTAVTVNGGPVGMNNITIDGASNLNIRAGDTNVNPTVDSIEEFKVMSGTMSAEYGYTAGGVVNIVTKSGSNSLHGTLYDFLRNDALDARNAFAATIAPYRYNQYGGALGGRVKRDRTFFFFNYEGYNYLQYYTAIGTTPTLAQRQGDFSQLFGANGQLIPIYDPRTTIPNPAGSGYVRTPFPGNVIPTNALDKVAVNVLQFYPLPNHAPSNPFTQSNNYLGNLPSKRSARQELIKIDHRISPRNQLSGRYMLWDAKNDNASTGSGYFSDPLARVRNDDYANRNVNLTDSEFFSAHLINQFQFNIARQFFPFRGASFGQNEITKLGLPASVPNVTVPVISIPEIASFPAGFAAYAGTNAMQTFQLTDGLTWLKGKHSLKVGLDLRRNLSNSNSCSACSGSFSFNSTLTGNAQTPAGTGYGVASFLVGAVASASMPTQVGSSLQNFDQAYYVQDDWKISQRLTVNLGLRYDYQQVPWERHNGLSRFNPFVTNPQNGLLGEMQYAGVDFGRPVVNPDYKDFGPRIGFAWGMFGGDKTVLRGGYGLFYPLTFIYARNYGTQGFQNTTTYSPPGGNVEAPAFYLQNGFPSPFFQPQGAALGPSAFQGQNVVYDEPNSPTPYSQQFTLTLQRQLPGAVLVEGGYSGNKGTHLGAGIYDWNQLDPQNLSLGNALLNQVANPYAGRVSGAYGGPTITQQQLLRPYPYMGTISINYPHLGSSTYHSMFLSANKKFSRGLVLLASYSYGKLISNGLYAYSQANTEQVNVIGYQNGKYDLRSERAVDSTNPGSRFVASGVYELPFGAGHRWQTGNAIATKIISGWQMNGALTLQDGLPVVISGANNRLATRPNSTGSSAGLANPTASEWFNVSQFVNPPSWTYGNIGRTLPDVRNPGIINLDLSLIKDTAIHERLKLQFRAEAFNVLNNVNLMEANGTFVPGANGLNISGTFGTITASRDARTLQLALKLIF